MNFLLDTKVMSLVLKCGVPPKLAGCTYLSEAVELRAFRNASAMDIYRTIAVIAKAETGAKKGLRFSFE